MDFGKAVLILLSYSTLCVAFIIERFPFFTKSSCLTTIYLKWCKDFEIDKNTAVILFNDSLVFRPTTLFFLQRQRSCYDFIIPLSENKEIISVNKIALDLAHFIYSTGFGQGLESVARFRVQISSNFLEILDIFSKGISTLDNLPEDEMISPHLYFIVPHLSEMYWYCNSCRGESSLIILLGQKQIENFDPVHFSVRQGTIGNIKGIEGTGTSKKISF